MALRAKAVAVKKAFKLPAPLVTFIQIIAPPGIAILVQYLTVGVSHLSGYTLVIYIAATGVWHSLIVEAEKKWPNWAWLAFLLPSTLPTD